MADPTVIIILIKFWNSEVPSMTALKTLTKDEDEPGLNCSAVILVIQIPIPSINASKMAPTAADLTAAEGPPINNQSTRYAGNFSGAVSNTWMREEDPSTKKILEGGSFLKNRSQTNNYPVNWIVLGKPTRAWRLRLQAPYVT